MFVFQNFFSKMHRLDDFKIELGWNKINNKGTKDMLMYDIVCTYRSFNKRFGQTLMAPELLVYTHLDYKD